MEDVRVVSGPVGWLGGPVERFGDGFIPSTRQPNRHPYRRPTSILPHRSTSAYTTRILLPVALMLIIIRNIKINQDG